MCVCVNQSLLEEALKVFFSPSIASYIQNESEVNTPDQTPKIEMTPKKRVVAGGTIVEDIKVGHGPEAKPGKKVSLLYHFRRWSYLKF